jgi:hypothetical protein
VRALTRIEVPVPVLQPFKHEDIANVLFRQQSPIRIDTPFATSSVVSLQRLRVAFSLILVQDVADTFQLLSQVVYADASAKTKISQKTLQTLPPWCITSLLKGYTKYIAEWQKYFTEEIHNFCKEGTSRFYWTVLQKAGVEEVFSKRPLSLEQQLWISVQDSQIQRESNAFMIALRDSILPWLNPKMWQEIQEKKEKTRTNIDYEEQRKQMVLGNFPTQVSQEDTTDWDVIK